MADIDAEVENDVFDQIPDSSVLMVLREGETWKPEKVRLTVQGSFFYI